MISSHLAMYKAGAAQLVLKIPPIVFLCHVFSLLVFSTPALHLSAAKTLHGVSGVQRGGQTFFVPPTEIN